MSAKLSLVSGWRCSPRRRRCLAQGRGGRGGAAAPPQTAEGGGAHRSHRLLGLRRHRRLALSHGHARERRLPGRADDARGARKIADAWDPAKEEASGDLCKSYGAPALLRVPGRLHITWQDDQTLRMDTDAGKQTRMFHFGRLEGSGRAAHDPGRLGGGMGRRRARRHRRLDEGHDDRISRPGSCARTACRTARTRASPNTTS